MEITEISGSRSARSADMHERQSICPIIQTARDLSNTRQSFAVRSMVDNCTITASIQLSEEVLLCQ